MTQNLVKLSHKMKLQNPRSYEDESILETGGWERGEKNQRVLRLEKLGPGKAVSFLLLKKQHRKHANK